MILTLKIYSVFVSPNGFLCAPIVLIVGVENVELFIYWSF